MSDRAVRPSLLVLVEGQATETQYVQAVYRAIREKVTIELYPEAGLAPKTMVETACAERKKADRDARKGRGAAWSEVWCIFDCDEHPDVPDAMQQARDNDINIAFSNPCLELWFTWHFQDLERYVERWEVQDLSSRHLKCKKRLSPEALALLLSKTPEASARAERMRLRHIGDGDFEQTNPSSDIPRFLRAAKFLPAQSS